MDILLHAIELVCISVGTGSALIFDMFCMLSLKDHRIQTREEKMLSRISLFAGISAALGLFVYVLLFALKLESGSLEALDIAFAKVFLFAIALLTSGTLRKLHLPALLRHQRQYFHLSEKFSLHQDSFVSTAAFSSVAWIFILVLTLVEQYKIAESLSISIFMLAILYIICGLITSRLAVFFKNKYLA